MNPPNNKGKTFAPEPLSVAEVSALLNACSTTGHGGVRDRALIAVMYGAGLRVSEALALKPSDVDTSSCSVRVLRGKGDKARTAYLDAASCAYLTHWLDRRKSLGLTGRQLLFCSYSEGKAGKPLDPRQVRTSLARLGVKAGIDKRVHPHGLRHSLAVNLLTAQVPLHKIQQQLGHSRASITDAYLRGLSASNIADDIEAANLYGEERS